MNLTRVELRKHIRKMRRALSTEQQLTASHQIALQVKQLGLMNARCKIAAFIANDGEISPQDIIKDAWQLDASVYLPVLHPFAENHLAFFSFQENSKMRINKYNIPEPYISCPTICPVNELDLVFVPLVAFDKQGNRMGMGGGYYDRTFAQVKNSKTRLIGLAHDCQCVEKLPVESWDVPLDMLITPSQIYSFN
ncbi:5-formyltetrahydrofolate cyclo-ligase [Catenovulum sediminis]|uniref:5-formyltetrahydrofolate cyclo-ligase n=1 Tax=Catenovulum sediminis TaxID=1740262 RepID=A0ABV1RMM4_9ALTE|nr:5-formyltetrahydrofolate cyclo-ligase [Catenovulum sediminis]